MLAVLVCLVVAGCAEPAPELPSLELPPSSLEFNACDVFSIRFTVPASLHPGQAPSGWEHSGTPADHSSSWFVLWDCQRFAMAGFERPLRAIALLHDHHYAPAACWPANLNPLLILDSLLVSDGQVAQALADQAGLPAFVADIQVVEQASPNHQTWSWTSDEGTVTLDARRVSERQEFPVEERWAWPVGAGLVTLDVVVNMGHSWTVGVGQAEGSAWPPITVNGLAVALAQSYTDADISGSLHRYEGTSCVV